MDRQPSTRRDLALARFSVRCFFCKLARKNQTGLLFWLVKLVERRLCPFCRAYERVYGRKSHEPLPAPGEELDRI